MWAEVFDALCQATLHEPEWRDIANNTINKTEA
jgi:hypothetical protein